MRELVGAFHSAYVCRYPAEHPQTIDRKRLPTVRSPHQAALFTTLALEAEPPILVARRDTRPASRRIYATVRTSAPVTTGIGGCRSSAFSPTIDLPALRRGRTHEPYVPFSPVWISEISECHITAPPAITGDTKEGKKSAQIESSTTQNCDEFSGSGLGVASTALTGVGKHLLGQIAQRGRNHA